MILVGCCGFPVSRKKYYESFSVVEVQKTFYQIPRENTLLKWRDEAPNDFEFIIKAWQGITHPTGSPTWRRFHGDLWGDKENYGLLKFTEEVRSSWVLTVEAAELLGCNKIILQLPPRLIWSEENKYEIMNTLDRFSKAGFILIVEPRNESWFNREVERFFRANGIVHCVDPFKWDVFKTGGIFYFRLHGIDGYKYSYKYNEKDLVSLVEVINRLPRGRDVYVMFNNKFMFYDALSFRKLLINKGFEVS